MKKYAWSVSRSKIFLRNLQDIFQLILSKILDRNHGKILFKNSRLKKLLKIIFL